MNASAGPSREAAQLGPAVAPTGRDPAAAPAGEPGDAQPLPPFVPPVRGAELPSAPRPAEEWHGLVEPGAAGRGTAAPAGEMEAAALADVAERLERIAASLRTGHLEPLLVRAAAEDSEPLEVLIAGYALGYSAARASR